MKTFFSIVGTTSTGKTEFAFKFATTLLEVGVCKGVLICSLDSRQVYKGLEILSGTDIPSGFIIIAEQDTTDFRYPMYKDPEKPVIVAGQSIITPDEEWSLSHAKSLADELAEWCDVHEYALMFVGGTGLYHKQLQSEDQQQFIPPDTQVRTQAQQLHVEELQAWLASVDTTQLARMNNSDRHNPRRLIRAIEKALYIPAHPEEYSSPLAKKQQVTIGLRKDTESVTQAIEKRIDFRIESGALDEVKAVSSSYGLDCPASSTIGFREIYQYLAGELTLEQCKVDWQQKEVQYVKRQTTWWSTYPPMLWLDAESAEMSRLIAELIDQYTE